MYTCNIKARDISRDALVNDILLLLNSNNGKIQHVVFNLLASLDNSWHLLYIMNL